MSEIDKKIKYWFKVNAFFFAFSLLFAIRPYLFYYTKVPYDFYSSIAGLIISLLVLTKYFFLKYKDQQSKYRRQDNGSQ